MCGQGAEGKHSLNVHLLSKHKDDPATIKLIEEGVQIWKCKVVGCRARYLTESRLKEHANKVHGGNDGGEQDSN